MSEFENVLSSNTEESVLEKKEEEFRKLKVHHDGECFNIKLTFEELMYVKGALCSFNSKRLADKRKYDKKLLEKENGRSRRVKDKQFIFYDL